ncbi:hypothetical protein PBI_SCTP2_238 [Salicola phage SCTP-2]|nr:hypothetical protein PBI_SCTP2_238 [Salicola phage SCTP-2]
MNDDIRIYKSFSTTSPNSTENGQLYDIDVIKEDIRILLLTRKGEYPMMNNIGNIAYDFIFDPDLNDADKQDIISDIEDQLESDPRLDKVNVYIEKQSTQRYIVIVNAIMLPMDQQINLEINLYE